MKYEWKDYLVSELAKFHGVSNSTIRHYDSNFEKDPRE